MKKIDSKKIIVALDVSPNRAIQIIDQTSEYIDYYKIGHPLFVSAGDTIIKKLREKGKKLFLDFKYHDIPNTVALAIQTVIKKYQPEMITLHTSGGKKMLESAVNVIDKLPKLQRPVLLGVTVLTSLADDDIKSLRIQNSVVEQVERLARLAYNTGLNGIVCSGNEIELIRKITSPEFVIVVPGVRIEPLGNKDDQQRVVTPNIAVARGANFIVLGRPIYEASDPKDVIKKIRS